MLCEDKDNFAPLNIIDMTKTKAAKLRAQLKTIERMMHEDFENNDAQSNTVGEYPKEQVKILSSPFALC